MIGSLFDRMTKAEREVACKLQGLGIQWSYEQPVFVWDLDGRPRVWTPDFYLKQFGVYLEVCGSQDFDYEYRKRVFSQNGYCVIFLHVFKGKTNWERHFKKYLRVFLSIREISFSNLFKG